MQETASIDNARGELVRIDRDLPKLVKRVLDTDDLTSIRADVTP